MSFWHRCRSLRFRGWLSVTTHALILSATFVLVHVWLETPLAASWATVHYPGDKGTDILFAAIPIFLIVAVALVSLARSLSMLERLFRHVRLITNSILLLALLLSIVALHTYYAVSIRQVGEWKELQALMRRNARAFYPYIKTNDSPPTVFRGSTCTVEIHHWRPSWPYVTATFGNGREVTLDLDTMAVILD